MTVTSSYSISEAFLAKLTSGETRSFEGSTFAHLSTSSLRCSFTTLACALRIVIIWPSLTVSSYSSKAMSLTQPYWSPTMHSATRFMLPPSYRLRSRMTFTEATRRCMLTRDPGWSSDMLIKTGVVLTIGLAASF